MDKDKYLAESHRQLSDERFYKKLQSDPKNEFSAKITETLQKMYDRVKLVTMFGERFVPIAVHQANSIYCRKFTKKDMPGRPIYS
jgi:hypothetical protein